jgi:hypothetical protein
MIPNDPNEPGATQELLIEATVGAHRQRDPDGLPVAPAEWWDLSPEACEQAFRRQLRARAIESAVHERGWSSTVVAVMARL